MLPITVRKRERQDLSAAEVARLQYLTLFIPGAVLELVSPVWLMVTGIGEPDMTSQLARA